MNKKGFTLLIPFIVGAIIIAGVLGYGIYSQPKQVEQNLSGTLLRVPAGGTGATSFSAGDCLIGAGTGAITTGSCGIVSASTAIGQFPYYAGTGTTLTATSSIYLGTNQYIGIGTTTPRSVLNIAGTRPQLTLTDTSAGLDKKHWFLSSQGGEFYIGTSSDQLNATTTFYQIDRSGTTYIGDSGTDDALVIDSNGYVGIGSSTPSTNLGLVGNAYLTGGLGVGFLNTTAGTLLVSGNVGIGTTSPAHKLDVYGNLRVGIAGANDNLLLVDTATGNVGIGTSSPYARFAVAGESLAGYFTATTSTATSTLAGGLQTNLLNITSITATSSFANGIQLTNGCFRMANGVCAGTGNGTVTSVAMTVPTGLTIAGSPITTSGTLALTLTAGYIIPTTAQMNLLTFNPFTAGYFIATSTGTSTIMAGLYGARVEAGYFYSTTTQASLISYGSSTAWTINSSGRLYIPANTNPVINATGDIGINTTAASSSVRFYDGTAERSLFSDTNTCYLFGSSTFTNYLGLGATSSIPIKTMYRPETFLTTSCYTWGGSGGFTFGDGANFMEYTACSPTSTSTLTTMSTNNTFIMGEALTLKIKPAAGTLNMVICVKQRIDAD